VLTPATCAALAGSRSFKAVAEWAADAGVADAGRLGAHYLLIVKANRPRLVAQLAALTWTKVRSASRTTDRGHGRLERRA
jgi:hypothetical protein